MNIAFQYLFIHVILFFFIDITFEKEITIKNHDENWNNLKNVINDNQNDEELILRFVDNYYTVYYDNIFSSIELMITGNVSFIGNENGTVFDFLDNIIGYNIQYLRNKGDVVKFEKIIFKNSLVGFSTKYSIPLFAIRASTDYFNLIFSNCTFEDNKAPIMSVDITTSKSTASTYSVQINDCFFR
ncbi:hypothetical protein PIROE2DRAFT_5795 [Piromyces sp. E2]|nr:hypothetical protein PIROE2DRAFT_5795 [Piromyces sp. E2]|eukprot:OUM66935.1 hypothetical protein PIROE2DRAFT_5795 [Piromyces sp. E2]